MQTALLDTVDAVQNPIMAEQEQPKPQHRVTLEDDIFEVVQRRMTGKGKVAASRFANRCLRAYFVSKGWMPESQEPDAANESRS